MILDQIPQLLRTELDNNPGSPLSNHVWHTSESMCHQKSAMEL